MKRIPKPGRPARGSATGRPVMVLLDLLGRRGALRLLWELHSAGALRFRELVAAAGSNPALVNTRLGELRETGLVKHDDARGYLLTSDARALMALLLPIQDWAKDWARWQ